MLRRAISHGLIPAVVFFVARAFLDNGDALLVAAVALALVEARRRWRSFQASAPTLSKSASGWRPSGRLGAGA
jgi:hypothetical protein